jgi:CRISPR type III-B/RAMP module-associated protein Cmr3
MSRWTLTFTPQDTLLFKGHRPFAAGDTSEGDLVFPQPSSLWGALVTALARGRGLAFGPPGSNPPEGLAALMAAVDIAGPWLAKLDAAGGVAELWLPTPLDLGHERVPAGAARAWTGRPSQLGAGAALAPRDLLKRAPSATKQKLPRWIHTRDAQAYADAYPTDLGALRLRDAPIQEEERVGHARDPNGTRTVEEGMLYASKRWRLDEGAALVAEVNPTGLEAELRGLNGALLSLGGKGRRVRVGVIKQPLLDEAQAAAARALGPARLWLLTPAVIDETAAAALAGVGGVLEVGHPEGGWDFEVNKPKALRRTLKAGSVLLLPPGAAPLTTDRLGRTHIGMNDTHQAGWGLALRLGHAGDRA